MAHDTVEEDHAQAIHAIANGLAIQWRRAPNDAWQDWTPESGITPLLAGEPQYRKKPEVVTYRRFLWRSEIGSPGSLVVSIVNPADQVRESRDQWTGFIRWIDTDWLSEEV